VTWVMQNLISVRLETLLVSVRLEIVLILTLDRFTVCAEHTIDLEIIMDTPDRTPSDVGHVKSCFSLFGDNVSVSAR
jgi:hypothetical protein